MPGRRTPAAGVPSRPDSARNAITPAPQTAGHCPPPRTGTAPTRQPASRAITTCQIDESPCEFPLVSLPHDSCFLGSALLSQFLELHVVGFAGAQERDLLQH